MKVLSLFNGISCGYLALCRAGFSVDRYVSYEIDNNAILVSQWHFPDVEERGSVSGADFTEFNGFDLVIGGFPCTDLSISKQYREGLKGKASRLFWEQVRAIEEVKPRYFLVENNHGMPAQDKDIITAALGVEPVLIDSALVSAQTRKRYYWTNIPQVTPPEDKGISIHSILKSPGNPASIRGRRLVDGVRKDAIKHIPLTQCIEVYGNDKSACLTTINKGTIVTSLGVGRYPDAYGALRDKWRNLTMEERELLQTLPEGYTECISPSAREQVIGLAWTVDVIAYIFNHMHLDEIL